MEILKTEGFRRTGSRNFGEIKLVESRFSVLLRNGPEINPSIKGMTAADAIYVVKRKSALRKRFNMAESSVSKPEITKEEIKATGSATAAGRFAV